MFNSSILKNPDQHTPFFFNTNSYVHPAGAIELNNSNNINNDDEYQRWALNISRKTDHILLPSLFSKINVKFIQDSVKNIIKENMNVDINTKQDLNSLLNLMMTHYLLALNNNIIYNHANLNLLVNKLNQNIIDKYVKDVISGLNMYNTYINDISNLPIPISHPVQTNIKGSNPLHSPPLKI
tara:strand:- start:7003 stop:7548 length:546 start_codon:yes stop_codon:yes gene_type:complete